MNGYFVLTAVLPAGCVLVCIAVCMLFRLQAQKAMRRTYQNLLERLDRAIGGEIQDAAYDESMDAAVTERLNRVVQISGMNLGRAETERDQIKSLISDISHQVRTPLTNIMLYAGLLQEQELSRGAMALVEKIGKQSEKLDFFMRELVKSSYAEQEMISIYPKMMSAEEIVNTSCQNVELAALKKKIDIAVQEISCERAGSDMAEDPAGTKHQTDARRLPPNAEPGRNTAEIVRCYADKKWTTEALGNVLDNAIKYSPENSRIEVKVIPYESFVCIQVEDQGIGIREEEQGKVFERFYRSRAVSSEPGFGIGLYLVREVLSKEGGYVKIRSEVGRGTAVQLYLSRYEIMTEKYFLK